MNNMEKNNLKILLGLLKNGEIGLNDRRQAILDRVPQPGDWAAYQYKIEKEDLMWLTAKTDDSFTLLQGDKVQILLHGNSESCNFEGILRDMLQEKKLSLDMRCRPGRPESEIMIRTKNNLLCMRI